MIPRAFAITYVLLLALLAATVALAYVNLGALNLQAAMLISVLKALLVILIFMELRTAPGTTKLVAAVFVIWAVAFLAIGLVDAATRNWPLNLESFMAAADSPATSPGGL